MRLVNGVDGEAGAMGKEPLAPVVIERGEEIPQIAFTLGQGFLPGLCARRSIALAAAKSPSPGNDEVSMIPCADLKSRFDPSSGKRAVR